MSLISSLYTGATGLEANSTDLSVIGDNIANANTIGFKESRASFQDAMSQQMIGAGTATSQMGLGTQLESIQKIITQGAISNTGLATDLAIDGNGFFVVSGAHNGTDGQFYTRAGQFTVDNTGTVVNLEGLHVQGYTANTAGVLGTTPGDLALGDSSWPASADDHHRRQGQPRRRRDRAGAAVRPAEPGDDLELVDQRHRLRLAGHRAPGRRLLREDGGRRVGLARADRRRRPDRRHRGHADRDRERHDDVRHHRQADARMTTAASTFNPLNATNPQPLTFNFGDPTGGGGTGLLGITQFAGPSGVTQTSQDGFASGSLTHIAIDKTGNINGTFTNGQTRLLGQVATALVKAPDQMDRVGGNLFAVTPGSGQATLGAAGGLGRGNIVAGALEQSNVDLANEFVKMIAAQRAYQANGKTIVTADSLLQELMQIKR